MSISVRTFAVPRFTWSKSPFNTVVAAVCAALTLLIVYPLVGTVWKLFSGAEGSVLDAFIEVYGNPRLPTVLWNTVLVVGASIVVAVVVGTILAWLNERTNARVGWSSDVLPVVSLLVPSTAGAIGWLLLGSPYVGYINGVLRNVGNAIGIGMPEFDIFSRTGMIFVYSLYLIPQVYLVVAAAMRNIDPAMEEAARISGRRTLWIFLTVTLPSVRPAVVSGALLALIYGLSMFSIPLIIGTQAEVPILTVEIVRMVTVDYPADLLGATLLSLLLLVAVLIMNSAARSVSKRGNYATIGGKASGQNVYRFGWGPKLVARMIMFGYVTIGCLLPVAALCLVALQPYWSGEFNTNFQFDAFRGIFEAGTDGPGTAQQPGACGGHRHDLHGRCHPGRISDQPGQATGWTTQCRHQASRNRLACHLGDRVLERVCRPAIRSGWNSHDPAPRLCRALYHSGHSLGPVRRTPGGQGPDRRVVGCRAGPR